MGIIDEGTVTLTVCVGERERESESQREKIDMCEGNERRKKKELLGASEGKVTEGGVEEILVLKVSSVKAPRRWDMLAWHAS